MPLIHRQINPNFSLAVWRIEEELSFFENQFSAPEISNDNKRLQWYATRHLINELCGKPVEVLKDKNGRPYLNEPGTHISLSHTAVFAAAMLSNKAPVGIDLEMLNPKVERIAHKFLRSDELQAIRPDEKIAKLILYWSAKESLYKLHGRKQLEFMSQLLVAPFELQQKGELTCDVIADDVDWKNLKMDYEFFEDHALTYILGR